MNQEIRDWADQIKAGVVCQVPATHVPTSGELNNLAYLSMKYIVGWEMRQADLMVILLISTPTTMEELDTKFIPAMAEYIWDHLCGETDVFDTDDLEYAIRAMRDKLYGMDEATRNDITPK